MCLHHPVTLYFTGLRPPAAHPPNRASARYQRCHVGELPQCTSRCLPLPALMRNLSPNATNGSRFMPAPASLLVAFLTALTGASSPLLAQPFQIRFAKILRRHRDPSPHLS